MPVTHTQLFSPRLETALLSASAITLSFGMAYGFHLERPYWAGIAAMVLSQSAQGQSLQKGLWRMAGTVLGAAAGMA
ncbi:MAG: FUSC family protein, partial [Mailhella sp.]|nr:FUSC family protein [Mailhella sp.]